MKIERKKRFTAIILVILLGFGCYFTIATEITNAFAAGSVATTTFVDPLRGSDGKPYKITGNSKNIIYNENGKRTYEYFNSNLLMEHFRVTSGKKTENGFCIEWGIAFHENQIYKGDSTVSNSYFNDLSDTVKNGIQLATVYGYQKDKKIPVSGCNADDWYMATQTIIWEYQQGIRLSPTKLVGRSGMPAGYFNKSISGRPAGKIYSTMLKRMSLHNTIPSFTRTKTLNCPVNIMKYDNDKQEYTVTIFDNNKLGKSIQNISDNIKMIKSGAKYIFSTKEPLEKTTYVSLKNDLDIGSEKMLVWGKVGRHQSIVTGITDTLTYYAAFKTEKKGICKIKKTSEDGKIEGIKFTISGNNINDLNVITDEQGIISEHLQPGEYLITESEDNKYIKQEPQKIVITEDETKEVLFHNELKKGVIKIKKSDESNGKVLEDCGIELLDANKKTLFKEYTDKKGIVEFSNIKVGEYYFREFDAPEGYLIDTSIHKLSLTKSNEIVNDTITNKKMPAQKIKKIEIDKKAPVTGDDEPILLFGIIIISIMTIVFTFIKAKK